MIKGQTVMAVILARGGSKRVPRKNTRLFRGKPLLEWTIDVAQQSHYLDRIVLSTDDAVAAAIGLRLGVTVLTRPEHLCTDDAKSEDGLRHALDHYDADWIVLLQPTSPLRVAEDIDSCIERAQGNKLAISFVSDGDTLKKNGAVYVCWAKDLMTGLNFNRPAAIYMMPPERSLDIDYLEQFE